MSDSFLGLLGGETIIPSDAPAEAIVGFYGYVFGALIDELQQRGVIRFLGYQRFLGGSDYLHFLGAEVESFSSIPSGLVGWELTDTEKRTYKLVDGCPAATAEEPIEWMWQSKNADHPMGEFSVAGSTENAEYWISSHLYIDPGRSGSDADAISLSEYDRSWPDGFKEMERWLRENIGQQTALRIEHYGSTSIPNMPAKPVIDILIEVPSFSEAKRSIVPLLCGMDWEYWWNSGHMFFMKRDPLTGRRTHHLHVAPRGHEIWKGIAFRDYLRTHPDEAAQYADLKRKLAETYGGISSQLSREQYTRAKSDFVRDITEKALSL